MEGLSEILKCRNAAVHGFLLGRWPDGKWAFETTITKSMGLADWASTTVLSFGSEDLRLYALMAEKLAETAGSDPYIAEQRKELQNTPLQSSSKSQPKKKLDE